MYESVSNVCFNGLVIITNDVVACAGRRRLLRVRRAGRAAHGRPGQKLRSPTMMACVSQQEKRLESLEPTGRRRGLRVGNHHMPKVADPTRRAGEDDEDKAYRRIWMPYRLQ